MVHSNDDDNNNDNSDSACWLDLLAGRPSTVKCCIIKVAHAQRCGEHDPCNLWEHEPAGKRLKRKAMSRMSASGRL